MIFKRLFLVVFTIILAIGLSTSCKKKDQFSYFLIKVDSTQVTSNTVANTPFDIFFYGRIGWSGCCTFDHFVVKQDNFDINIEVWGKVDNKAIICPSVNFYLTGHIVTHTVDTPGTYDLKIRLPDNTFLENQIIVK